MTETRTGYITNHRYIQTSTDELIQLRRQLDEQEAERVGGLPRDELIHQLDGECDSQQELIERLAEMVIEARQRVKKLELTLAQCQDDECWVREKLLPEARQWARDLLARCKNLEWLAERIGASWREDVAELEEDSVGLMADLIIAREWALLWKRAAKFNSTSWRISLPREWMGSPWYLRRRWVENTRPLVKPEDDPGQ